MFFGNLQFYSKIFVKIWNFLTISLLTNLKFSLLILQAHVAFLATYSFLVHPQFFSRNSHFLLIFGNSHFLKFRFSTIFKTLQFPNFKPLKFRKPLTIDSLPINNSNFKTNLLAPHIFYQLQRRTSENVQRNTTSFPNLTNSATVT
jgi:hypothetical protein